MNWVERIAVGLAVGQAFGATVSAFADVFVNELFTYRRYRKALTLSSRPRIRG